MEYRENETNNIHILVTFMEIGDGRKAKVEREY